MFKNAPHNVSSKIILKGCAILSEEKGNEIIQGFKGFDKDLKCREFQYEVGKEYEQSGKINCCHNGFHFCEHPLDVFNYYPPASSRYCSVEGSGNSDKDGNDSKVSVSHIKISAEVGISGLIQAAVKFVFSKADWSKKESHTTGYQGAASSTGKESVAMATGYQGKAKGSIGNWIVLAERDDEGRILIIKTHKVDGKTIKANVYYVLQDGKFVKSAE